MRQIVVLALLSASVAFADPAAVKSAACPVTTAADARSLADALYEQGDYQRAGECYVAAGETELANRAFTKAVGPASEASARRASDQAEQAKALIHRYKLALRLEH